MNLLYLGLFTNYVDRILAFFDHLPPSVDIFYCINIDKKTRFLDYLLPFSCKCSLFEIFYNYENQNYRIIHSNCILCAQKCSIST